MSKLIRASLALVALLVVASDASAQTSRRRRGSGPPSSTSSSVRAELAAVLLESGKYSDAAREYRALLTYPDGKRAALREILGQHHGSRALVFTADNATAYAIARELLVMPITHEIRRSERTKALAGFRTGECPVLVSSQVLEEGFDVPDADVSIVVGGTKVPAAPSGTSVWWCHLAVRLMRSMWSWSWPCASASITGPTSVASRDGSPTASSSMAPLSIATVRSATSSWR